jgi:hypothetical protein
MYVRRAWARGSETHGSEGAEGRMVVLREGSIVGVEGGRLCRNARQAR